MTRAEIEKELYLVTTWQQASGWLRDGFVEEMKNRSYGHSPLMAAWCWFCSGWKAAADRMN